MSTLLFVYGTLKRGCCNHAFLAGQSFVGPARTVPGFTLYDLGGFPGIAACSDDREGVAGEVWSVDADGLRRLDAFEGVHEGLYRRVPIALAAPFAGQSIDAYFPTSAMANRPRVGQVWREGDEPRHDIAFPNPP